MNIFKSVIGHRGSPKKAPENTMSGFRQAQADGAKVVELDVQLSGDGEIVVIHDDTLERTTNGTGAVKDKSLAELRRLDAGSWFGDGQFAGEKVPTLREALSWAKETGMLVDVEVKKSTAKVLKPEALLSTINEADVASQVGVTSFDRKFIENLEAVSPNTETGILVSAKPTWIATAKAVAMGGAAGLAGGLLALGSLPIALGAAVGLGSVAGLRRFQEGRKALGNLAAETRADALVPHKTLVTKKTVKSVQEAGKAISTYTVNDQKTVDRFRGYGIDGIITDSPEKFLG